MGKERRGRKTKLTADIIKSIYAGIKNRLSWKQIAYIVGIDPKTLRNWRERGAKEKRGLYRKLVDTIERAESELRVVVRFESPKTKSDQRKVCFIQGEITGLIHISETRNPHKKIECLRSNSPDALKLLTMLDAGKGDEKQLHSLFTDERMHGEWFSPSKRLLKFIGSL